MALLVSRPRMDETEVRLVLREGPCAGAVVHLVHSPAGVSVDVVPPIAAESSTLAELRAVGDALRLRGLRPRGEARHDRHPQEKRDDAQAREPR